MAGQSYRQKRTKNSFVERSAVSSLLVDYGLVLESLSSLLHGWRASSTFDQWWAKNGPSYENFCKTHAVRFANWDHRWLASLTADCSAVIDVLVLNRTLATYFQKCIPGPGEKGFLGFRGLHAASFVDMRYAESFYAPITRKIATFLPDARRGIEWWCLQIINGKSWNNVWWLLPFLTWNRSDQTQAWQKDTCADYVPWNIFQPTFPWLVLVGLPAYLLALRWLLALKSV